MAKSLFPEGEKCFGPKDRILTMGSCFARTMRAWLKERGMSSENISVPSGLNNSFAVRQYLEWAITGKTDGYWYDTPDKQWEGPEILAELKETSGFIITFGLAEVWRDKETKGVFWRGVPKDRFDEQKHECVLSTVEENVLNMKRIHELLLSLGDKKVFFTLSPVPLNATFMDRPAIVSDCVSKSTMRVALDLFFSGKPENALYWPSFEMVRWVGAHTDMPTIGHKGQSRDVDPAVVQIIIERFVDTFFNVSN